MTNRTDKHARTLRRTAAVLVSGAAALLAVGCATAPTPEEADRDALQVIRSAFRDEGIVKTEDLHCFEGYLV